jgi:glycosyltransferase involved in cell wall biosynthesis
MILSVVIPAYNEEQHIGACVKSVLNAISEAGIAAEIIVVDNDSTDRTAEIATSLGCRVIFEPFRQIARARNRGASEAKSPYLIFLDADTLIAPDILKEALRLMMTGRVTGGGALIQFDCETGFIARLLLRFWQAISRAARYAAGCFVFATDEAFKATGGFDERVFASEEISFSRRMRAYSARQGMRFVVINQPGITTSARKNQNLGSILLTMLIVSVFPLALRFRSLCFHWYNCRQHSNPQD